MSSKIKQIALEWFNAGESDYLYAEVGIKEKEVFPQVCFLAQQVAEKYLKGFLIMNDIEPPRTHELLKLLGLCIKIKPELDEIRNVCELLTGFYIESRYPTDVPAYTKQDIQNAFNSAKLVKETIEGLVQKQKAKSPLRLLASKTSKKR